MDAIDSDLIARTIALTQELTQFAAAQELAHPAASDDAAVELGVAYAAHFATWVTTVRDEYRARGVHVLPFFKAPRNAWNVRDIAHALREAARQLEGRDV